MTGIPRRIVGVVEATAAAFASRVQPSRTDHCQQDPAGRDAVVNRSPEITAHPDGRNVHEDGSLAKLTHQVVEEAARFPFRVMAPVADKDRPHVS